MQPKRDPRAESSTIRRSPQAFITKKGDAVLIRTLDDKTCQGLVDMYLAYQPRSAFQGLPPITDEACVKWVGYMIQSGINLVALSFGEGVVGHTVLFPIDEKVCELLVVVSPKWQNAGIGTQLTRCSVQMAYEMGFDRLWLPVARTNLRARHVYKKCGFEYLVAGDRHELEMALDLKRYDDAVNIPVEKIMNRDVRFIDSERTCREAAEIFLYEHVASLPVVDRDGKLIGILSESDLMLPANLDKRVGDIFTRHVLFVRRGCTVAKVVRMFQSKKVRSIPVVDEDAKLVGIVGRRDVLIYYAEHL